MTKEHTPGPWKWVKRSLDDKELMAGLVGANDVEICHFGDAEEYYPVEGEEPNAADKALIAAAPCLLEALEKLLSAFEKTGKTLASLSGKPTSVDLARAAISKARGREGV